MVKLCRFEYIKIVIDNVLAIPAEHSGFVCRYGDNNIYFIDVRKT